MNEIITMENPKFGTVRKIEIGGSLMYCATDCARALGYANPHDAVKKHCFADGIVKREGVSRTVNQYGKETNQTSTMTWITKGNVLRLIASSRLPAAQEFNHWLFDDVAVSVVDTGVYLTPERTAQLFADPAAIIAICQNWQADKAKLAAAQEKIALDAPKVHFANSVESSQSSILIGTMAKLLKQNGVDTGEKRLFRQLREDGFLCDKGKRHNVPTQKAMELGLFDMTERTFSAPSGEIKISVTTKVTGKGQTYFLNRYAGKAVAAQ